MPTPPRPTTITVSPGCGLPTLEQSRRRRSSTGATQQRRPWLGRRRAPITDRRSTTAGREPRHSEMVEHWFAVALSRMSPFINVPALLAALPGAHGVSPSVAGCATAVKRGRNVTTTRRPTARSESPIPRRRPPGPTTRDRSYPVAVDYRQVRMTQPAASM